MPRGGEKYGYKGLYLERSGVSSRQMAEILTGPPEFELTESELEEAYAFEAALYDHEVVKGKTIEQCFRDAKDEGVVAPLFFARSLAQEAADGEYDISHRGTGHNDVYAGVANTIRQCESTPDELRVVAKKSMSEYISAMAEALQSGEDIDPSWLDFKRLVVNPTEFISVTTNMYHMRDYLQTLRFLNHEGDDRVAGAKRAILDLYLAKANAVIVNAIPIADYMAHQGRLLGDDELVVEAGKLVPDAIRRKLEGDGRNEMFRRLDYLRSGLGIDEDGNASSVAREVTAIRGILPLVEAANDIRLTGEQVERMKHTMLSPEQMLEVFTDILRRAGKLSSEPSETWSPERTVRAADEQYQVVVHPTKNSFAVDGVSGAYKVASEPRSLYDVMFVGGFHELTHINQAQADQALGRRFKIANLKGKRPSMLRESGANVRQKAAESEWTGSQKPVALTYARALQVLEHGGGDYGGHASIL